jgi:hypothetical protein
VFSFESVRGRAEARIYRRAAKARRIARRVSPGAESIVILLVSLGLWGAIWLAVSSLVTAWLG